MTRDFIVKNHLLNEIRTFTEVDDLDVEYSFFSKKHVFWCQFRQAKFALALYFKLKS